MMAISWEKKCENRRIPFSNRTGSYPGTLSLFSWRLYLEGRFNGGFFALQVQGAYIWRGLYIKGLIYGTLQTLQLPSQTSPYTSYLPCFQSKPLGTKLVSIDVIQSLPFWEGTRLDGTGLAVLFFFYINYACNDFARDYPVSTSFPRWKTFLHHLQSRRPLRLFYRETVVNSGNLDSTIWKLIGRKILPLLHSVVIQKNPVQKLLHSNKRFS